MYSLHTILRNSFLAFYLEPQFIRIWCILYWSFFLFKIMVSCLIFRANSRSIWSPLYELSWIINKAYIFFFAVIFASLGLSGIIPAIHIAIKHGFMPSLTKGQLGWLYLMAVLYLTGKWTLSYARPSYLPNYWEIG